MPKVMIVGEAWGKDEAIEGKPFVGASGRLLNALLKQVGINREECYVTNVFNFQPAKNDIKTLCGSKAEGIQGMPAITKSKYVLRQYQPELDRLWTEVRTVSPDLILALGASAAWALLKTSGIRNIRGAPWASHLRDNTDRPFKVLPTYHPAAVLREWKLRPILLADLYKAVREAEYRDIRRPQRHIWIEPSLDDLAIFESKHIMPSRSLSIDIETVGDQITCVGFAPSHDAALVVPFFDDTRADKNYWRSLEDELKAWEWVRRMCALEKAEVVGQNFLYDVGFLWSKYGIKIAHATDDTMLLHHALQPEMEKGLGFLGSIYTNEAAWKTEYKHSKTNKKED